MRRTIALLAALSLVLTMVAVAPAAAGDTECKDNEAGNRDVTQVQYVWQSAHNVNFQKAFAFGGFAVAANSNYQSVDQDAEQEVDNEIDCD